jgi:tRNA dimethylallyltransferase
VFEIGNSLREARLRQQLDAGFLVEARSLRGRLSRTAGQALGYRELLDHLDGKLSLDAAVDNAVTRTRAFARRQRMWFRRDPRIAWFGTAGNPLALLPSLLGHWARP